MEHTKTPWTADKHADAGYYQIHGQLGTNYIVALASKHADARRIVAAVNATANIKTEVLETINHPGGHSLIDGASWKNEATIHAKLNNQAWNEVARLKAENRRLLNILKGFAEYTGDGPPTTPWQAIVKDISEEARAAIAHAESNTAPRDNPLLMSPEEKQGWKEQQDAVEGYYRDRWKNTTGTTLLMSPEENLVCEGECKREDRCKGAVKRVLVSGNGFKGSFKFSYCQEAQEEDRRRGFVVEENT